MRFDEVLPSLESGRRVRRKSWKGTKYLAIRDEFQHIRKTITVFDFGSEGLWPSPRDADEILADDWELMPVVEHEEKMWYPFRLAIDALTSDLPESPPEETPDELALAAVTALVHLRGRDKLEHRLQAVREGALKAFLALGSLLEEAKSEKHGLDRASV